MPIKAIIDLGSNTFHLLIAEINEKKVKEYYRKRIFTGLCEGGIEVLKESSIERGLEALEEFKSILKESKYDELLVTGTAALRNASNALEFIMKAEAILSTKVHIIDGLKEAELIFRGAQIVTDFRKTTNLIMDIGGGSTELIIVKDQKLIWSQSYKLGVGVLHQLFHKSEPIANHEMSLLRTHIYDTLDDFRYVANKVKFERLVGASGSFEVLETMTGQEVGYYHNQKVSLNAFHDLSNKIVDADYKGRLSMKGLPENRVKLIVVAMILIEEVLKIIKPREIEITPYALKEGILVSESF
jgi:exopolyphosphatase / guanosine-5'-triphosphate,3'-diphosphate pyrophosphatase